MDKRARLLGLAVILTLLILSGCRPAATGEPPASGADTAVVPDPASALDVALDHLRQQYGDEAPPPDLDWTEENITAEGLVGASTFRYQTDSWNATVSFPVVLPSATVYTIELFGRQGEFYWQGQVDAQGNVSELKVNPVEEAGLAGTTQIDILELDLDSNSATHGEYVARVTIVEPELVNQMVAALDTDLVVAPKLSCIPEYTLRFQKEVGNVQEFGYSCGGASFLRGEQAFWQGQDFFPAEAFDALLGEQLAATLPRAINVVEALELGRTIQIDVTETVSTEVEGSPGVMEATVHHLLAIQDAEVIAQLVATLDTELALEPRARVLTPFVLEFQLDDGNLYSLGYLPGTDAPSILRGDDRVWGGQDARPPVAFERLLGELLASGQEGAVVIPDEVRAARDAALSYVSAMHGEAAPAPGLSWTERRTTPEGLVGAEHFEFSSGAWVITVSYPVVAPEYMAYQITIDNGATGFHWEGEVGPDTQTVQSGG